MSEEKNNFKELEKQQLPEYEKNLEKVKNSIDANVGTTSFITDVIELYFSKVLNFFIKISGGDEDLDKKDNS